MKYLITPCQFKRWTTTSTESFGINANRTLSTGIQIGIFAAITARDANQRGKLYSCAVLGLPPAIWLGEFYDKSCSHKKNR